MKVCILTTSFPLRSGDLAGIFILEQARSLVKLGMEVEVVAPHSPGAVKRELVDGVSVRRVPYILPERYQSLCYGDGIPDNIRKGPGNKLQLPFLLLMFLVQALERGMSCDIIHAHWSIAGLSGLVASRLTGRPVVLTMHHGSTRAPSGIEKLVLERVDCVLCNSAFTLEQVRKSASPRMTGIMAPGIDLDRFRHVPEDRVREERKRLSPDGRPVVFSLGRLIELKGHACLIRALARLPLDRRCRLVIGGDGPLRKDLEDLAGRLGLEAEVTFLGQIPPETAPVYYSLADIYVQPSIVDSQGNTEGLGMTLVESLACGTPCIGSRTGGIPDIVRDGVNGFLVDPGDPLQLSRMMLTLLEDRGLRAGMGENGRRLVEERYSWEAKAAEHARLYADIITGQRKRGI